MRRAKVNCGLVYFAPSPESTQTLNNRRCKDIERTRKTSLLWGVYLGCLSSVWVQMYVNEHSSQWKGKNRKGQTRATHTHKVLSGYVVVRAWGCGCYSAISPCCLPNPFFLGQISRFRRWLSWQCASMSKLVYCLNEKVQLICKWAIIIATRADEFGYSLGELAFSSNTKMRIYCIC